MSNDYKDRLNKLKEFKDPSPPEKFGDDTDLSFLADAYRRLEKMLTMKETWHDRVAGEIFARDVLAGAAKVDIQLAAGEAYKAADILLEVRNARIKS